MFMPHQPVPTIAVSSFRRLGKNWNGGERGRGSGGIFNKAAAVHIKLSVCGSSFLVEI
jgi:hypothetical protein